MMYDLQKFGLQDMIAAGRRIRQPTPGLDCMEEAARLVVDFFYDNFRSQGDDDIDNLSATNTNCVLVRCFKTHAFGELPEYLQTTAASLVRGPVPMHEMQCLTLLASRGDCREWNSRFTSASHQAIPLPTVDIVLKAPMISQLILQLGMKIEHIVQPLVQPLAAPTKPEPTFDVFHVPVALGSAMVPEQEGFVRRFGIKSVLGFGGLLPAGELFAIILFTRVTIPPETAALFRTLALGVKLTLLPFSGKRVFAES